MYETVEATIDTYGVVRCSACEVMAFGQVFVRDEYTSVAVLDMGYVYDDEAGFWRIESWNRAQLNELKRHRQAVDIARFVATYPPGGYVNEEDEEAPRYRVDAPCLCPNCGTMNHVPGTLEKPGKEQVA